MNKTKTKNILLFIIYLVTMFLLSQILYMLYYNGMYTNFNITSMGVKVIFFIITFIFHLLFMDVIYYKEYYITGYLIIFLYVISGLTFGGITMFWGDWLYKILFDILSINIYIHIYILGIITTLPYLLSSLIFVLLLYIKHKNVIKESRGNNFK